MQIRGAPICDHQNHLIYLGNVGILYDAGFTTGPLRLLVQIGETSPPHLHGKNILLRTRRTRDLFVLKDLQMFERYFRSAI